MSTRAVAAASVTVLAIVLALPVAEIVIGARYVDTTTCSNARVIAPATWLLTSGVVGVTALVAMLATLVRMILREDEREAMTLLYLVLRVLSSMFGTAWSIVGAVSLWRDNTECSPGELHDMMWTAVIIHLIGAATILFSSGD